jgi:glycosyltransferase involved in cell wall biosynthesis
VNDLAVSVVIPTYNRARLVVRAVASALVTCTHDDEILVVDDGSTDGTEAALAPYRDRIRLLRGERGGAGAARNRGIREARRPLVALLDSDDEWWPDKLQLQRAVLQARPEALSCFSNFGVREEGGSETPHYLVRWSNDLRGWDEILGAGVAFSTLAALPAGRADFRVHVGDLYPCEMERDYILTSTFVVRRERAGTALRFAEDVPTLEDWECFGRVLGAGPAAFLDCDTAWQWGHSGPRLTDAGTDKVVGARLKLLERVWGADGAFLARHGDNYRRVRAAQHLRRAACLIHQGRTREARLDLRRAGTSPLMYRLLAAMPGPLTRGLLRLRRLLASLNPGLPR